MIRTMYETMIAIYDATSEINGAIKDLKESGIINDITSAVKETTKAIRETIQMKSSHE
jgi:uncharacterized protein YjgD (DUF1641 family)